MRVLIWGGDSWANRGDEAVLAGTLASVKLHLPAAMVTVASDRPDRTEARHQVAAVRRVSLGFLRELARAELVLWGGGVLIQDASSRLFLAVQLLFLLACVGLRKPVMCFAQGVGPVNSKAIAWALLHVLKRLALITVRDDESAERLRRMGVPGAVVTADPSFCLEPALLPAEGRRGRLPYIAVALRRWGHYQGGWRPVRWQALREGSRFDRFCVEVAAALDRVQESVGVEVLFVPMCPGGDQHDDLVAERVRGLMRHPASTLQEDLPLAELKCLLGQTELVVAMRSHAGMLAAGAGTPVVSIDYQGKGHALMATLGMSGYCLNWDSVTADRLTVTICDAVKNGQVIRERLCQRIPELQRLAGDNARLAAALIADPKAARWARAYDGTGRLDRLLRERRRVALALLQPQPVETVLDAGCGPGGYASAVQAAGACWIGVDTSAGMLALASTEGPVLAGSAISLPVRDGAVSALLAVGLADYLPEGPLTGFAREAARVLACGGRAVVSCNTSRRGLGVGGLRTGEPVVSPAALIQALASAGLNIEAEERLPGGRLSPDTLILLARKP